MKLRVLRLLLAAFVGVIAAASVEAAGTREAGAAPVPKDSAPKAVHLEAGYMPILPDSQLFVIAGKHWAKQKGIDLKLVKFSDGPAMVQAVASGKLDIMYFGIGPAMVAYSKGIAIKVVASNIVRQIGLIAEKDLAASYDPGDPAATFAKFEKATGRKARIATFPKGSVPDTVLRYWLVKRLGIGVGSVDILAMGASRVQEALLAGKVDGAATLEPILTIVQQRRPGTKVIARASAMFPGQPGAVLAVRDRLIAHDPQVVQSLVSLQVRATRYLQSQIPQSAKLVADFIGKGLVSPQVIEQALRSPSTHFMADPRKIVRPSQRMLDFQVQTGSIAKPVDLSSLFDTHFYVRAVSQ